MQNRMKIFTDLEKKFRTIIAEKKQSKNLIIIRFAEILLKWIEKMNLLDIKCIVKKTKNVPYSVSNYYSIPLGIVPFNLNEICSRFIVHILLFLLSILILYKSYILYAKLINEKNPSLEVSIIFFICIILTTLVVTIVLQMLFTNNLELFPLLLVITVLIAIFGVLIFKVSIVKITKEF